MLKGKSVKDTTYYIGYKVRFDSLIIGPNSTIVFQWKAYKGFEDPHHLANVPISLRLHRNNVLAFNVSPLLDTHTKGENLWSTTIVLKRTYQFGIVINTASKGFVQLYFNGKLVGLLDRTTGEQTTKLTGNFFSGGKTGCASPKVGLYGDDEASIDSYIYNVRVGTSLSDIKGIAGIS